MSAAMPAEDHCPAQDLYAPRVPISPALKAEADRQWAELDATDGDPVLIRRWVRDGIKADDAARAATGAQAGDPVLVEGRG